VISRTAWTQLKDVKEGKNKMKENAKATRRIKDSAKRETLKVYQE